MAIKYDSVVPWGRSYHEYTGMFSLTEADLNKSILGCGDGPAGFNSAMNRNGKKMVSVDPIYQLTANEIEKRIDETCQTVISQTKLNQDKFIWTTIKNVEELAEIRMTAMKEFLSDYEIGRNEKRYVYAELPVLPFSNNQFDLALSSHFLFLYSDNLSLDFHIQAINEILRVSGEVRIFPLLDVNAIRSPYVEKVIEYYSNMNYSVNELKVNYEFQKGGNTMLRIKKDLSRK
jgi:hypothetical protein